MADNPEDELFQAPIPESGVSPGDVAYGIGAFGVGLLPGGGFADIMGYSPDPANPGKFSSSFSENLGKGKYADAALQALGGVGDAFLMMGATAPLGVAFKGAQALGKSLRGAKAVQKSNPTAFFEAMGDQGALLEFPNIGENLNKYIYDIDFNSLNKALSSEEYLDYADVLRANLDKTFPGDKIPVSRTKNYSDPKAGVEGRREKNFFEVDKDDVLFAGYEAEGELIVRGPQGRPMSVRIEPDKFQNVSDLTTPELVTSWVIAPNKVNRSDVARRLLSDETAVAKTNQALDSMGYGDTVPVFRMVRLPEKSKGSYAEFFSEGLVSATLDPQKVPSNIKFMTQGKYSPFENADYRLVRYDVPRSHIAGYLPAISGDINRNVNKAVKARGFGQEKIAGLSTVTNPAEHAKRLIGVQDEIIVDVSGIDPKFLSDPSGSPVNMLALDAELPNLIAEGKVVASEDISNVMPNYTVLNPVKYFKEEKNVPFDIAEKEARDDLVRQYREFFGVQNKAGGGIVGVPVDDRMINPEILSLIESIMAR